jgi:hypothetical protein
MKLFTMKYRTQNNTWRDLQILLQIIGATTIIYLTISFYL